MFGHSYLYTRKHLNAHISPFDLESFHQKCVEIIIIYSSSFSAEVNENRSIYFWQNYKNTLRNGTDAFQMGSELVGNEKWFCRRWD